MILIIIHTPISRKWFQFNDCILIEGRIFGSRLLNQVFRRQVLAFSIPMILTGMIYIVGLPLGLLVWLVRHRTKLYEPENKDSIGWMYMPYKRQAYFWEIEEIVRKMILSGGLIFLGQMPSVQLCVAMSLSILFHQLHSLWKPNANQIIYYVQHVALGAVELVYICGMLLLLKEPVPDGLLFGASGGTMIFGLVVLGLALMLPSKVCCSKERRLEYEKNLNFRQNLKRRVSQLEEEKATEKNAEILDVALVIK